MSVSVLIISHAGIGNALLNTLHTTFGSKLPLTVSTVDIQSDCDPECLIKELRTQTKALDQGNGVLLLTDLYGSTPSNIAQALRDRNVRLVTGVNMPMLMRIMNYPNLDLDDLADKALEGGQSGIIES